VREGNTNSHRRQPEKSDMHYQVCFLGYGCNQNESEKSAKQNSGGTKIHHQKKPKMIKYNHKVERERHQPKERK
jgi:hypothetical protein